MIESNGNIVMKTKLMHRLVFIEGEPGCGFITDPDNNTHSLTLCFTLSVATGKKDITPLSSIVIFYNKGILHITGLSLVDEGLVVNILDVYGRKILEMNVRVNDLQLEMPMNVVQGVYLAKITDNRNRVSRLISEKNNYRQPMTQIFVG